jgi:hypothetical protein
VVARVDAADDTIRRFVVHHYRYDHDRHERRHVIVAAFDNKREFEACLRSITAGIERRRLNGEPVDRSEHASGVVHQPGHLRRTANGHLVRRMIEHGIDPQPWVSENELRSNMSICGYGMPARHRRRPLDRFAEAIRRWRRGLVS